MVYDPFWSAVALLISGDGADGSTTFTDESRFAQTATVVGNTQVDDSVLTPWGEAAILFDGSGDYITFPDVTRWQLFNGATIECWVRFTSLASDQTLIAQRGAAGNVGFSLRFETAAQQIRLQVSQTGTTFTAADITTSGVTFATNTWYHVAAQQNGDATWCIFIDGTQRAVDTQIATPGFNSTAPLSIGAYNSGTDPLNGRLAEIRFTKGEARYGTSFTPSGPHTRGAPALTDFPAMAFVKNAAPRADWSTTDAVVLWTFDIIDTDSFHDESSNTSRFTISSTYNGRYGRFRWSMANDSTPNDFAGMKKNGSFFRGGGQTAKAHTLANSAVIATSAPIPLATSDYIEAWADTGTASNESSRPYDWAEFQVLPAGFSGAVIYKSATQSYAVSNADATLTLAGTHFDIGTWTGFVSNALTVPSGVSLIRLNAGYEGLGAENRMGIQKNGSNFDGMPYDETLLVFLSVESGPLAVSAGDDFTVLVNTGTTGTIAISDMSYLGIEALSSALKYATVKLSGNFTTITTAFSTITWGAEVADTNTWHDTVTNNSRLTVPSGQGIKAVRLHANFEFASASAGYVCSFMKNGKPISAARQIGTASGAADFINMTSNAIPVVDGDYFEIQIAGSTAGPNTITAGNKTWFSIEEVAPETTVAPGFTKDLILDYRIAFQKDSILDWEILAVAGTFTKDLTLDYNIGFVKDLTLSWGIPNDIDFYFDMFGIVGATKWTAIQTTDYPSATLIDTCEPGAAGAKTIPDSPPEFADAVGPILGGFYDLYYERIWIKPTLMRLTNPQYNRPIPFEVWNAYSFDNDLNTVDNVALGGFDIDQTLTLPFLRYELIEMTFSISESAPARVDGYFTFNFDEGTADLHIIATIVEVNRIAPEVPMIEEWKWETVSVRGWDSTEQRAALRSEPRISLSYDIIMLDDTDRRAKYNEIFTFLARDLRQPFFQYGTRITSPAAEDDVNLFFNPALTNLRDDEFAVLVNAQTEAMFIVKVATVNVDGCTLENGLEFDIDTTWQIVPTVSMRINDGSGFSMQSIAGSGQIQSRSTQFRTILRPNQAEDLLTEFDGYPVLHRRPLANESVDEAFTHAQRLITTPGGQDRALTAWAIPLITGARQWNAKRPAEMDYWRLVGKRLMGSQNPFLLPSWRKDLTLFEEPLLGSGYIDVNEGDYVVKWEANTYRRLQIETANGIIYREILDLDDSNSSYLRLVLSDELGSTAGDNEISVISFMNVARITEDAIRLEHYPFETLIEINITTVNE